MAKIIGIDIQGRYVRAALLSTSYRKIALESLMEIDRTQIPGLDEAVQACLLPLVPHSDAIAVAVDGDAAFVHRLRLPVTAAKQLSEVIPFELEAQVPVDIDELVYDFIELPREIGSSSIDILAAAVRADQRRQTLASVALAVGEAVRSIYLTGGGAAASGAADYLAAETQVTVTALPTPSIDGLTPEQIFSLPRFSRAVGLALGLRGRAR